MQYVWRLDPRRRLLVLSARAASGHAAVGGRAIPPSVLPDISPSRGEITRGRFHRAIKMCRSPSICRSGGADREDTVAPQPDIIRQKGHVVERKASISVISPREGEMPGRAEGGAERLGLSGDRCRALIRQPSHPPALPPERPVRQNRHAAVHATSCATVGRSLIRQPLRPSALAA
ncbi:hypothetical protein RHI9324_01676 [Rhizobium sp. CECT 9324]|nr:hypothetical protein RHI9324_01676 [Rhizobium sp. CECT 9324]